MQTMCARLVDAGLEGLHERAPRLRLQVPVLQLHGQLLHLALGLRARPTAFMQLSWTAYLCCCAHLLCVTLTRFYRLISQYN